MKVAVQNNRLARMRFNVDRLNSVEYAVLRAPRSG